MASALALPCVLLLGWPGRAALAPDGAELQRLRQEEPATAGLRQRYLQAANEQLYRYWQQEAAKQGKTLTKPQLLFAGDSAQACGVNRVEHPMAFYCPTTEQIALGLDLRRSAHAARGRSENAILPMDLAVLAHEWGHHVNRVLGLGPYRSGFNLTAKQEELAADWRAGTILGWMLKGGWMDVEDFTAAANLMFELGDYELITPDHHGYPKERFEAITQGLATQLTPGQQLGAWTMDTRDSLSRPIASSTADTKTYDVLRFEIDRSGQITTNLLQAVFGTATCLWGDRNQCLGAALQQGKGRAYGRYTQRQLVLHCTNRSFDVSDDNFRLQPITQDGKGQAAVLAQRDC